MTRFIIRWAVTAIALYATIEILQALGMGIYPQSEAPGPIILLALVFGLVNALLRPLITMLTCPLIILTLGLGALLINTVMFWLAGLIGTRFGFGFTVDNFWTAFVGALIMSVISFLVNGLFRESTRK